MPRPEGSPLAGKIGHLQPVNMINKLLIVGCGLIGGSFAGALKQARAVTHIVACDVNGDEAEQAVQLGVADAATQNLEAAAADADFIFIATPVATIPAILSRLSAVVAPPCVITDAGSTKADLVNAARAVMGVKFKQYLPGHPIAGRETSGVSAAQPSLFEGKNVVLTPHECTEDALFTRVSSAWSSCGANVVTMTPQEHDKIFAAVSHLPHLLAFALVDEIASRENAEEFFNYAASGFRDFTRIAASSPDMWRDIALQNKTALQAELTAFQLKITQLQNLLEAPEAAASAGLHAMMSRAQHARKDWKVGQAIEPKA